MGMRTGTSKDHSSFQEHTGSIKIKPKRKRRSHQKGKIHHRKATKNKNIQ